MPIMIISHYYGAKCIKKLKICRKYESSIYGKKICQLDI